MASAKQLGAATAAAETNSFEIPENWQYGFPGTAKHMFFDARNAE